MTSSFSLEIVERLPETRRQVEPVLFVHGAWQAAWCWENYQLAFAKAGIASYALSLRGHGGTGNSKPLRWTRIKDCVADVAQAIAEIGDSAVIVGHSMGGLVVQKYLERHDAPTAVLLASVPPAGVLRTTLNIIRHHPLAFLKTNLTLSLFPIIETRDLASSALFANKPIPL